VNSSIGNKSCRNSNNYAIKRRKMMKVVASIKC
jgi:hypothetical protein